MDTRGPRLRRIHSNLTVGSLLTATDSTESDIRGPGRLVGRALLASGKRIEPALSRAAEFLGYGPNAIVRKLVVLIKEGHCRGTLHAGSRGYLRDARVFRDKETPQDELLDLICYPCRHCRQPLSDALGYKGDSIVRLLGKLLEYTTHNEGSTRLLAIEYVTIFALASDNLRICLLALGAYETLQRAQTCVFYDLQEGWKHSLDPTAVCISLLQKASTLLSSIEPHHLDVDHPSYVEKGSFKNHQRYHAYVFHSEVKLGLRTLVDSTQTSGIIGRISVIRLQAILKYGLCLTGEGYWSRHHGFLDVLSDILSADDVEGWWTVCKDSELYQALLYLLYEGIHRWSIASWRSSSVDLKERIIARFYFPFLLLSTHALTSELGKSSPNSPDQLLLDRKSFWLVQIRTNLTDAAGVASSVLENSLRLLKYVETTFVVRRQSAPPTLHGSSVVTKAKLRRLLFSLS